MAALDPNTVVQTVPLLVTALAGAYIGVRTLRAVKTNNGQKLGEHVEAIGEQVAAIRSDVLSVREEQLEVRGDLLEHTAQDTENFDTLRKGQEALRRQIDRRVSA